MIVPFLYFMFMINLKNLEILNCYTFYQYDANYFVF